MSPDAMDVIAGGLWNFEAMDLGEIWVGSTFRGTFTTLDLLRFLQTDKNWSTCGRICHWEAEPGCYGCHRKWIMEFQSNGLWKIWVGRKFRGTFVTLDLLWLLQTDKNWSTCGWICGQEAKSGYHGCHRKRNMEFWSDGLRNNLSRQNALTYFRNLGFVWNSSNR